MAKGHQNWWSFFVGLMGNFAQKVNTCARFLEFASPMDNGYGRMVSSPTILRREQAPALRFDYCGLMK